MSLIELQSAIKPLPRLEKFQLIQWIMADLAQEEAALMLRPGATYPIWSPYDAYDAAETLWRELQKETNMYADEHTTIPLY
ncbi:hypothetical protein U27_05751 [Candidatus Vecturithrix granuli]|uniref:Uncharacterized protein n=1 Tax=Vecturithrix granuli TaxID=1499967 RepID=A0A081C2H1_VECG1|nr:hypothetical protein U27_05751 [Candidatus Vecturithrix granuli]